MKVWHDDKKLGRDPARIPEVLDKLRACWEKHPQLRLGQLLCNITAESNDPYFIEDDLLVEALDNYVVPRPQEDGSGNQFQVPGSEA